MRWLVLVGLFLFSGAFWFPGYSAASGSCEMPPPGEYGAGECFESVTTTQTLAEVNGYGVLLWLLAPCIAAIVVAGLLILSRRGSRFAKVTAWVVVGLFALLAFISGFSIGMYFVPAAVLVALAVALSPPLGTARCRDLLPREM